MFRASLCTLSSSLFRRSSATKIYIYIYLFFASEHFAFVSPLLLPPTARAFFRGFFRGRIDTNCKTLSTTVLPTTTCRSETIVETAAVFPRPRCRRRFCSFILGNSGPSWPRFRVMFVCSFARSPSSRIVKSILRKFSRRRGIWRIFF